MKVLLEKAQSEIIVKKSRFISIALPCHSAEEVRTLVKAARDEYPDSTHVVHAAVLGDMGTIYSMSDDKEPKNTAGRPALEVLKGSGITNILVCIIRYFGGTLLGTGGLVKAYGDSVKEVLKIVKTEELISRERFVIRCGYEYIELLKRLLASCSATDVKETYEEAVSMSGLVPSSEKDRLEKEFLSLTQGRCTLRFTD